MDRTKRLIWTALLVLAAVQSVWFAMGYRNFDAYFAARQSVKSLESGFPELERDLRRAVGYHASPLFLEELGDLYLDAAQAANRCGTAVKRVERDALLSRSESVYLRLLRSVPTRASPGTAWAGFTTFTAFPCLPMGPRV
jgi:hypothetical protein